MIQVFEPWMRQFPSASLVARVRTDARSEPVSGSVKTAVGSTLPSAMRGSHSAFCSGVPLAPISSPAISERVPSEPAQIQPRDSSSDTRLIASLPRPRPPYSGSMQTPKTPSSAISATTSPGISTSFRCQAWACGAIRSAAKVRNCSRIMSSVSSSSDSSGRSPSRMRRVSSARVSAVLPCRRNQAAAGSAANAEAASPRPSSSGRTNSFWLIGTPPRSWARYSPTPIRSTSASIGCARPAASPRSAQPTVAVRAATVVAIQAKPWTRRCSRSAAAASTLPDGAMACATRWRVAWT